MSLFFVRSMKCRDLYLHPSQIYDLATGNNGCNDKNVYYTDDLI